MKQGNKASFFESLRVFYRILENYLEAAFPTFSHPILQLRATILPSNPPPPLCDWFMAILVYDHQKSLCRFCLSDFVLGL